MSELMVKQIQFSKILATFILWIFEQGYQVRMGDVWRSTDKLFIPVGKEGYEDDGSYSYQELLFYNQKTKLPYGKHNERLAADLVVSKDWKALIPAEYRPLGEKWEKLGGRWGGRFGVKKEDYNDKIGWDSEHFEL